MRAGYRESGIDEDRRRPDGSRGESWSSFSLYCYTVPGSMSISGEGHSSKFMSSSSFLDKLIRIINCFETSIDKMFNSATISKKLFCIFSGTIFVLFIFSLKLIERFFHFPTVIKDRRC